MSTVNTKSGMDPLIGSGLITGGISAISSLFSGIGARKRMREYLDAQAAENRKAREYNLQLAQMQNSWNIQQWNRENEYNDPAAQMARLRNAGVNPDMFYSNGASGITAASSPQMTAGAPYTPQDMSAILQKPTIGDMLNSSLDQAAKVLQLKQMQRQNENLEKEGRMIDANTGKLLSDIELNNSTIKVNGSVEKLNKKQTDLIVEQIKKVDSEISKNIAQVDEIRSRIQNIDVDTWRKKVDYALNSRKVDAEIRRIAVQNDLDIQQLKKDVATFWYDVAKAQSDAEFSMHSARNEELRGFTISLDNQRIQYELDVDKNWRTVMDQFGVMKPIAYLLFSLLPEKIDNVLGGRSGTE